MIKFFFKMAVVFCVVFAAVLYHNTESGKEMEEKMGEALEFKSLKERGKALINKTIRFIALKGMDSGTKKDEAVGPGEGKAGSPPVSQPVESKEKMPEEERRRIEEIIESEG